MGVYGDGSNFLLRQRTVIPVGLNAGNGIHHIHTGGHLAESGVLAVQVLGILVHDEELAACGVRGGGPGHAQHTALMLQVIPHTVEEKLTLDAVAGAAHAGAVGAAALDHKAGNNPVEDQTVIVVVITQVDKVVNALPPRAPGFCCRKAKVKETAICQFS